MRFLMILTACLGVAFAQSNQDAESNMVCMDRLQMIQPRPSRSDTQTSFGSQYHQRFR